MSEGRERLMGADCFFGGEDVEIELSFPKLRFTHFFFAEIERAGVAFVKYFAKGCRENIRRHVLLCHDGSIHKRLSDNPYGFPRVIVH